MSTLGASWMCELGQGPSPPRHRREGAARRTVRPGRHGASGPFRGLLARCLRFQQTLLTAQVAASDTQAWPLGLT